MIVLHYGTVPQYTQCPLVVLFTDKSARRHYARTTTLLVLEFSITIKNLLVQYGTVRMTRGSPKRLFTCDVYPAIVRSVQ